MTTLLHAACLFSAGGPDYSFCAGGSKCAILACPRWKDIETLRKKAPIHVVITMLLTCVVAVDMPVFQVINKC